MSVESAPSMTQARYWELQQQKARAASQLEEKKRQRRVFWAAVWRRISRFFWVKKAILNPFSQAGKGRGWSDSQGLYPKEVPNDSGLHQEA